jgi:hypothetical protein
MKKSKALKLGLRIYDEIKSAETHVACGALKIAYALLMERSANNVSLAPSKLSVSPEE